ncbi:MAG: sigma-54-dependent Fis family transcriptional regulator [Candidatus Aminicenantes bacterium]|nr:sigma-54-dependent Fis family transcriptional regulator [Candidatus Aminicenantes bacterium]
MSRANILVIDDEAGIRSSLKGILEDEDYHVTTTESGNSGLEMLRAQNFDLVLLDIWLPDMNGIDVLKKIKQMEENHPVIMISGHGTVETAVKSTKLGAFDFLEKPLTLEKVVVTVKNAINHKKLKDENIQLRTAMRTRHPFIGKSPAIQKMKEEIKTAAPTNGRILIYGENGTGKELVARLIHDQSPRKNKKFVQINTAAIPDELLESELFGHSKGVLPHADKDKKGKLLLADGGTVFLDQISEMSLKTQAKLVHLIEEMRVEPIGSGESIPIDVRFIAATNKDLRKLTTQRKFLEDLYFKLHVIPLSIPPLRERKEDIPLLIDYFLDYFCLDYGKKKKTMSKAAMTAFLNYSWPGNVSELSNVIERFVIMVKEEEIKSSHLSLLVEPIESQLFPEQKEKKSLIQAREEYEKDFLHHALVRNKWNIPQTASDIQIEEDYLTRRIKELNITFIK